MYNISPLKLHTFESSTGLKAPWAATASSEAELRRCCLAVTTWSCRLRQAELVVRDLLTNSVDTSERASSRQAAFRFILILPVSRA